MDAVDRGVAPPGYYAEVYGDRDWRFYGYLLGIAVTHSRPGPMLDVGAGAGLLVEAAQHWGLDCVGIEGSEEGISLAAARGVTLRRHLLSEPLPYGDSSFATVFLNQVIGHLESVLARACLLEIRRVLAPGGMLYVGSPSRYDDAVRRKDRTILDLPTPPELDALLRHCGFVDLKPMNHPLPGRLRAFVFYRTGWSRLSATASTIAYRQSASSPSEPAPP